MSEKKHQSLHGLLVPTMGVSSSFSHPLSSKQGERGKWKSALRRFSPIFFIANLLFQYGGTEIKRGEHNKASAHLAGKEICHKHPSIKQPKNSIIDSRSV